MGGEFNRGRSLNHPLDGQWAEGSRKRAVIKSPSSWSVGGGALIKPPGGRGDSCFILFKKVGVERGSQGEVASVYWNLNRIPRHFEIILI